MQEEKRQQANVPEIRAQGSGKSVADAEAAALARLEEMVGGFDRGDVEIVVIDKGSRGFLGMGSNQARVEARLPLPPAAGNDGDDASGEDTAAESSEAVPASAAGPGEPEEAEEAAPGPEDDAVSAEDAEEAAAAGRAEAEARLRQYLELVFSSLGIDASLKIDEDEESLLCDVSGSDLGIFIGRHGQTIDAIQYLANAIAFRGLEGRKRIIVDAEGYRARRAEALRAMADRGVEEIEMGGEPEYELKPMSAAERRIIHLHLQDREGVETYSEGRDPYRRVIIARVEEGE